MCLANPPTRFVASGVEETVAPSAAKGSRRFRLWELPSKCHCPLIGACLPVAALRRIVGRVAGGELLADDYELHVGTVHECARRSPVSEKVQQALEKRHAPTIGRFRQARRADALFALWVEAVNSGDVAGAFWATLTHPCCDDALRDKLCCDMHMLQHHAAAGAREGMDRMRAMQADNSALASRLAEAQQRNRRLVADRDREIQKLNMELMQHRAAAIGRDTMVAALQAQCTALRAAIPELDSRERLQQKVERLLARLAAADEEIATLRKQRTSVQPEPPAPAHLAADAPATVDDAEAAKASGAVDLRDRTVLCVGGRSGSVANYRDLVENVGGRFAHHDGGRENNARQLDASLAAADLVICQTGCISHHAYWRVKDHCKRHNKRCVFLDKPSMSTLARGLGMPPSPAACVQEPEAS